MSPEMQTSLLNTYPPKLIATILKALREQLQENDPLSVFEEIAGPAPEIPLEHDQILKDGGGFWDDVNGGDLSDVERFHGYILKVSTTASRCRQTSLWIPLTRKFDRD